ncbi:MAG: hypothetical protein PHF37_00395 [Phycisphaerae bacterium]|nr:hypothetical protein [Phycisphaerae bacterium]
MKLLEYLEKQAKLSENLLISYDELARWPTQQIEQSQQLGFLIQTNDADGIICHQCSEHCWKDVEIREKNGQKIGVAHCEAEDTAGLIPVKIERLQQWKINAVKFLTKTKPISTKESPSSKTPKKRPTQKEMADRNRSIALAAAKFQTSHGRLPNVDDIVRETSYTPKQIYHTDPYKEGKIAKNTAKVTNEITGSSVASSEYFGDKSTQHTRAKKRSKADQAELDAFIEEQTEDKNSRYVMK